MAKHCPLHRPTLLRVGITGIVITTLCCLTPIMIVLSGVVGLSWLVGYLNEVLLPALVLFLSITIYAGWRDQHTTGGETS
jgi:mercuric ion transport protein